MPLQEVAKARADAQRTLWLATLAVLAVGALVAWLLSASLTRPLERLTKAAGRVARGAYDEPVGVRSADEIGTLANASDTTRKPVALTTGELRRERDVLSAVLEAADEGAYCWSISPDRPSWQTTAGRHCSVVRVLPPRRR